MFVLAIDFKYRFFLSWLIQKVSFPPKRWLYLWDACPFHWSPVCLSSPRLHFSFWSLMSWQPLQNLVQKALPAQEPNCKEIALWIETLMLWPFSRPFTVENESKLIFSDIKRLREFAAQKPSLKELWKDTTQQKLKWMGRQVWNTRKNVKCKALKDERCFHWTDETILSGLKSDSSLFLHCFILLKISLGGIFSFYWYWWIISHGSFICMNYEWLFFICNINERISNVKWDKVTKYHKTISKVIWYSNLPSN